MEVAHRPPGFIMRLASGAVLAALGATAMELVGWWSPAVAVDAFEGFPWIGLAALTAGGAAAWMVCLSTAANAFAPGRPLGLVLAGIPFGSLLAWCIARALQGPQVDTVGKLWGLSAAAAAFAGAVFLAWFWTRPRTRTQRRVVGAAGVVTAGAALMVDAVVLRDLYPSFHWGLRALVVVVLGWTGFGYISRPRPVIAIAGVVAMASAIAVPVAVQRGQFPQQEYPSRWALLSSLTAGPGLRALVPPPPSDMADEVTGAAAPIMAAPPELLDAAFPLRGACNILWVTVDTLRASRMSVHGYGRPTTPRLAAFAERGAAVFERAYAQHPSSALSFISMLASRYPSSVSGDLGLPPTDAGPLLGPLREGRRFLGVTALQMGYVRQTLPYLEPGLPELQALGRGAIPSGKIVIDRALKDLDDLTTPWLSWVHLFDPHKPYRPHQAIGDLPATRRSDTDGVRYDGEVAFADQQIGRLLDALSKRADWDRTVVVVCGDHGESLGERGLRTHGTSLAEEQIHVPLIIRVPGWPARRIADPVELVDIVPTLEELVGVTPDATRHGHSLVGYLVPDAHRDRFARPEGMAYAQFIRDLDRHDTVIAPRWKVVRDRVIGHRQLFDLDHQDGEANDVAEREAGALGELVTELRSFAARAGETALAPTQKTAGPPRGSRMAQLSRLQDQLFDGQADASAGLVALCQEGVGDTVGMTALRLLLYLSPSSALGPLQLAARHTNPDVRATAARLLAFHPGPIQPVNELLESLIADADDAVRISAHGSIALRGGDHGREFLRARRGPTLDLERWRVAALAHTGDADAVATLGSIVAAPDTSLESLLAAWRAGHARPESGVAVDLYLRLQGAIDKPRRHHVIAAALATEDISESAPLLRAMDTTAGDPDSVALRKRIRRMLGRHAAAATTIESALKAFRERARSPGGSGAWAAFDRAIAAGKSAPYFDWGLLVEGRVFRHISGADTPLPDFSKAPRSIRQLAAAVQRHDRSPSLETVKITVTTKPEFAGAVVVAIGKGALQGGLMGWGSSVVFETLDSANKTLGRVISPLPARGIGPGCPLNVLGALPASANATHLRVRVTNGKSDLTGWVTVPLK